MHVVGRYDFVSSGSVVCRVVKNAPSLDRHVGGYPSPVQPFVDTQTMTIHHTKHHQVCRW